MVADERVAAVAWRQAVRKMIRATGAAYGGKVASLQTLCVVVGYPRAAVVSDGLAPG